MMKILSISLLLIGLTGCLQSAPKLTPQQRRAMQVKNFESSYNNVFRGIKTVLQDEGYIIKNQDFEGGMILAQKETTSAGSSQFLAAFAGNNTYITGRGFEVSFSLEKLNKKLIETRMTLQNVIKTNVGGTSGKEIVSLEIYRSLYQKIIVEIERRKARGL